MKTDPFRFLILTAAFSLFLITSGCKEKIEPGQTAREIQSIQTATALAALSSQPVIYEALGSVSALEATTLSGKIMGVVKSVNVQEGQPIQKGDILLVLDERQVTAGLKGSEAQLQEAQKAHMAAVSAKEAAQAGARLAQATYERYRKLYEEESATRQEFEEVEARHHQAAAALAQADAMVAAAYSRIQQARAAVSGASVMQKDARITAPYDGIVSKKLINEGDLASPGTPLLIIEKKGGFQAELLIPELHIQAIRIGEELAIEIPDQKDAPLLTGRVQTLVPSADARTRSFLIKVQLPQNALLRSGMFARARIPVGEGGILTIPETARISHGQLTGYFMVDSDNVARYRLIRTGRTFSGSIEVLSGIKPGTRYVIHPPDSLRDGMKIQEAS